MTEAMTMRGTVSGSILASVIAAITIITSALFMMMRILLGFLWAWLAVRICLSRSEGGVVSPWARGVCVWCCGVGCTVGCLCGGWLAPVLSADLPALYETGLLWSLCGSERGSWVHAQVGASCTAEFCWAIPF